MMRFVPQPWFWIVGVLSLTGCGDTSSNPDMVPVTGSVTYRGQPVAGANVVFQADERGSFGLTDDRGRFRLQTLEPGDGALPGQYTVIISKVEITVPQFDEGHPQYVPPPPPKYLVPRKYAEARTSGLTANVVQGQKNEFSLELKD
jgi:hypothetical protein